MSDSVKYVGVDGKEHVVSLPKEVVDFSKQATKDYDSSYKFIQSQYYYTWRYALKAYHLSTADRGSKIKHWQQNVAVGVIRSFVDVLISVVNERPLTFVGTPINKIGVENKENILKSLNYVSDVTGFHRTVKQCLKNGLILGTICMRVGYLKTEKKSTITTIVNDELKKDVIETPDDEIQDYPYAKHIPIFNVYPDPYNGRLRYVTERGVISQAEFLETFGPMIRRKDNISPLKTDDFLFSLSRKENSTNAVLFDYGVIVNQVHQKVNEEARAGDSYTLQTGFDTGNNGRNDSTMQDEDPDVTEGLIEFKFTSYINKFVLHANGYPVCVCPNFFGFIPYVIKAAGDEEMRFGEGIPYMLRGHEEIANSFVNNYFDGARALSTPTFVAPKNLLLNEHQLASGEPGAVLWTEINNSRDSIYRLEKGGLNDFNVYGIVQQIAQQITGISEYNLGQSAGERTASGALSVTQSSNKRMTPYMSSFVDAMSVVAKMWLTLMKKYWTDERWIYVLDEQGNQTFEVMKNKNLAGGINISLQAEGLFGSTNELEMQKLISVYQTLAPSGFVKAPEIAGEIMKKAGFTPSRFILETDMIKPDGIGTVTTEVGNPNASVSDMLKSASSPQIDLGNGGEGR